MDEVPSTHDANGRFAKGNKLGQGNPLAGRAAKIRAIILEQLTPERAELVAKRLIHMAGTGDLAAIKELLDRTIGKPSQAEVLERVEKLEILVNESLNNEH